MRAFEKLAQVVKEMESEAIATGDYTESDISHILDCLDGCYKYHKYNFVFNVERHSKVKSHCISFLCSDPKKKVYQNICPEDCHSESCSYCDMVKELCMITMAMATTIGEKRKIKKATVIKWKYDIDEAETSIHSWRNFIIRNKVSCPSLPDWTISGIFNEFLSTQIVNIARFARNVE